MFFRNGSYSEPISRCLTSKIRFTVITNAWIKSFIHFSICWILLAFLCLCVRDADALYWAARLACSCHLLHQQSIRYPWLWALIWAYGSYKPRHLRAGRPSGLVVAARCSSLLSLRPSCLSSSAFAVLLCILDCSCFQRVFHRASCLTPLRPALDSLHSMPPICFNFTAPGCLASACMLR